MMLPPLSTTRTKWIISILIIMIASSCNDYLASDYPSSSEGHRSGYIRRMHLSYTHADSIEAGNFAVWYSGQNCPSDSLISELLYSLNYLRYVYGDSVRFHDSISVVRTRFMAPWLVSALELGVNDSAAKKIDSGRYDAWNRFPAYLRPSSYSVDMNPWYKLATLGFKGLLHPRRLAELYDTLPGVRYATPMGFMFLDWGTFPIYPGFDGRDWSYLFTRDNWAGPSTVWYFKYVDGVPHYIGVINPGDPEPTWWREAFLIVNPPNFTHWDGPPH
jgi:hypothetical protein